jgi:hypothetical protein
MADQSQHPNDTASGTEEFDQVWHEYLLAEAAITLPKPDDEMDAAVDRLSQCEWDVIRTPATRSRNIDRKLTLLDRLLTDEAGDPTDCRLTALIASLRFDLL